MANMVLTIGGSNKTISGLEVYRDLSMTGKGIPAVNAPAVEDYLEFLREELPYPSAEIAAITVDDDPYQVIATTLNVAYDIAKQRYEAWKASSKYTVGKLVNVKAVQNSLRQIFTWIPGERILNPEFGSNLRKYLYEGITQQNMEAVAAEIRHCVTEWEPRVSIDKVVNVQSVSDTENNTIRLDVYYHIKGLSDEQFVYSYSYDKGAF